MLARKSAQTSRSHTCSLMNSRALHAQPGSVFYRLWARGLVVCTRCVRPASHTFLY